MAFPKQGPQSIFANLDRLAIVSKSTLRDTEVWSAADRKWIIEQLALLTTKFQNKCCELGLVGKTNGAAVSHKPRRRANGAAR